MTPALAASAMAVTDNVGSYSYGELAGRVAYAAETLRARGVEAGATVLLLAPNRRDAVAAYLAALRVGARVVAMDRRAGRADVTHATELTQPRLVLADAEVAELVCPAGVPLLPLADVVAGRSDLPWSAPVAPSTEVVLFTSGTSSTPKAAVHTVQSLLAGVRNMAHTLRFTRHDAPFLVSPLAGITGLSQTHLALECGGHLLLEDAFSPESSLRRLVELGATVFGGAPFVLEELLTAATSQQLDSLPLRAVAVGGASIPRPLLELAHARFAIVPSRVYGSSECPIAFASDPADDLEARLRDEGVAMPGTEGRIDPVNSELQVRGENLFHGYLDPEQNVEAFTEDGWFRTGDQASLLDGRLLITGRLKEVVSRKGLKLSLAEIDEAMRGMPGTVAAAAYGLPDAQTGERLVVAVQLDPHAAGSAGVGLREVARWLASRGLATWKLPEQVVLWDEPFPYTVERQGAAPRLGRGRRRTTDRVRAAAAQRKAGCAMTTMEPGAVPTLLADGFVFGEGPRWRDGRLWLSDMHGEAVYTTTPEGKTTLELSLPGKKPSGLGFLPDGSVLIVSMAERQLLRLDRHGHTTVHADLGDLVADELNDMVVDAEGAAFVGSYPSARGTGVLVRVTPDGTAQIVADGLDFPNGTVISADGAHSHCRRVHRPAVHRVRHRQCEEPERTSRRGDHR